MSFQSLSNELSGTLPGLSPILADTYINRAWRDVRDARLWSFLQTDGSIVCPTQITTGTIAITMFSDAVTCDAAASAALVAVVANPGLTKMQIRFGGLNNASFAGQVYSIIAADTTNPAAYALTLDREVAQATNPTSGFQCYRVYVRPPVDDFLTWQSFVDMTNGWALRRDYTSTYFDARDPQRQAQGLAYYLGSFKGNPELDPKPQYELWPAPTSGQTFYMRFRRQGEDFFNPADTQPVLIPDQLIMQRALGWYAYPWAAQQVGRMPAFRGVGWVNLTLTAQANYAQELIVAKRQDDNQEVQTIINLGHGLRRGRGGFKGIGAYPIDANFIQSHLVNF